MPLTAARIAGVVVLAAAGLLAGCSPASSPDAPAIAAVHRHECSKCHAPPPPRTHTRVQLEDAVARHRARVHLSDDQWSAIVLYLSVPEGTATRQGN